MSGELNSVGRGAPEGGADDLTQVRCQACGLLLCEARPGSVVRSKCRKCRTLTEVVVQ